MQNKKAVNMLFSVFIMMIAVFACTSPTVNNGSEKHEKIQRKRALFYRYFFYGESAAAFYLQQVNAMW